MEKKLYFCSAKVFLYAMNTATATKQATQFNAIMSSELNDYITVDEMHRRLTGIIDKHFHK